MTLHPLSARSAGVLLHPTSLPGAPDSGDLGPAAYRFADFLAAAGQRWWQMLPIHPPGPERSPYQSRSAHAGSPWLISLELLERDGLLSPEHLPPAAVTPSTRSQPDQRRRMAQLAAAHRRFSDSGRPAMRRAYETWRRAQRSWLADYSLFAALDEAHSHRCWNTWPAELRDRHPAALRKARRALAERIALHEFVQFLFDRQWAALRAYCARRGVKLIGDVPIYVDLHSADVWCHRELFQLDATGRPTHVAGVPPDAFSATGQLWGNPLFRWDIMREGCYRWWVHRLRSELRRFDVLRLDHFIAFYRYWSVTAGAEDARTGRFRPGPRADFFRVVSKRLGGLPFFVEDLGLVIPEVRALAARFGLPGMRVLQFGFDSLQPDNEYLPHTYPRDCVATTGTHDNEPVVGWYGQGRMDAAGARAGPRRKAREFARRYAGTDKTDVHWAMMRLVLASVANTAIIPMQDLLGLGAEARMNHPGRARGCWRWRLAPDALSPGLAQQLSHLTEIYGRR